MAIKTEDIEIGTEWTKIELLGTGMIVAKVSGSGVKYRFGADSESQGMTMLQPIIIDSDVYVRAITKTAKLAVSR